MKKLLSHSLLCFAISFACSLSLSLSRARFSLFQNALNGMRRFFSFAIFRCDFGAADFGVKCVAIACRLQLAQTDERTTGEWAKRTPRSEANAKSAFRAFLVERWEGVSAAEVIRVCHFYSLSAHFDGSFVRCALELFI